MSSQQFEFQTETQELLHLMIHSLYSNKDIFLRELISNASDAIDKRRYAAITGEVPAADDPGIRLAVDAEARTLTIDDDGIGMSRDEVIAHIGTIAKSGTREFAELLKDKKKDDAQLIGQFGVGFYSSFLVADQVELVTRKAGEDTATRWSSKGQGGYTVEDAERERPGTTITLTLKAVDEEDGLHDYTDEYVLRSIVRRYSDFVSYPIRLHKGDDSENKPLNSMKAIWCRPPAEVTDEAYAEFYKHIAHDWNEPLTRLGTKIEGTFEASALLFVPSKAPFGLHVPNVDQRGIQLYVKRVFIMDNCEDLVPTYLRFMRGVVDAEDLPLNVSREILQQNRQVKAIKKHITKKVLDKLGSLLADERESYLGFWNELGSVLKEGLLMSQDRNEKVLDLMLCRSTHSDDLTTLDEYVSRMGEDQKEIYFLTGTDPKRTKNSPVLEGFAKRGIEVLVFTDQVDEIWLNQGGLKFKDLELKSAAQGDVDFGDEKAEDSAELGDVLLKIRAALQEKVKEVRASARLTDSAACLVTAPGDITPQMERLLRATGQSVPDSKRILEVNPSHPAVLALKDQELLIDEYSELLFAQAILAEGGELEDPKAFNQRIGELMVRAAKHS